MSCHGLLRWELQWLVRSMTDYRSNPSLTLSTECFFTMGHNPILLGQLSWPGTALMWNIQTTCLVPLLWHRLFNHIWQTLWWVYYVKLRLQLWHQGRKLEYPRIYSQYCCVSAYSILDWCYMNPSSIAKASHREEQCTCCEESRNVTLGEESGNSVKVSSCLWCHPPSMVSMQASAATVWDKVSSEAKR